MILDAVEIREKGTHALVSTHESYEKATAEAARLIAQGKKIYIKHIEV